MMTYCPKVPLYNPHTSSHGLAGVELTKPPLNALTSNQSNCNARRERGRITYPSLRQDAPAADDSIVEIE